MKYLILILFITSVCFAQVERATRLGSVPQFGGDIYYVDGTNGNDSNSCTTPNSAFATIGAGISALSAGDALNIMAATYTENDIDLTTSNCELWFEIGAVIQNTSDTALTISGSYCRVICRDGALVIDPNGANATGLVISGNFCYIAEVRVKCDGVADLGFDITGNGADLRRCRVSNPLVAAFKVQGDKIKLEDCCTGGEVASTSIGYWITNSCDKYRLIRCGSQGHDTAGFQVDAGCTNGVIWQFSSGGGDGRWTDTDHETVISDLTYENELHKLDTLVADNTTASVNLFEITGSVMINYIYGTVETVLSSDIDDVNLNLYDGTNTVQVTKSTTLDIDAAPVGSFLHKIADADENIGYLASDQVRIYEDDTKFGVDRQVIVNAKNGATTYLRFTYTTTDSPASGVIDWHIHWQPLSDDGYVKEL